MVFIVGLISAFSSRKQHKSKSRPETMLQDHVEMAEGALTGAVGSVVTSSGRSEMNMAAGGTGNLKVQGSELAAAGQGK
jgi:hypothetical protein